MPSPRGDAPVEFNKNNSNVGLRVPFRPSQPTDQMGGDMQPQSSPRSQGIGGLRQSSSSSVTSMRSVLVEPTLLPPPITGIQPTRTRTDDRAAPSSEHQPRGASFETEGSGKGGKKSLRFEQPTAAIAKTVI